MGIGADETRAHWAVVQLASSMVILILIMAVNYLALLLAGRLARQLLLGYASVYSPTRHPSTPLAESSCTKHRQALLQ